MAKVSIIVPVYNVEKYLRSCLDSIVKQTYSDMEIICINDGSTDSSLEILKEYANKDFRIIVIDKINEGQSSARNVGLKIATGDFCYFIDSDDSIELETIEYLVSKMSSNDVDCVIHNAVCLNENDSYSKKMSRLSQQWFDEFCKPEGVYNVPLDIKNNIPCVAWNKLYKMSIIREFDCKFIKGLVNEDEAFLWEYLIHCRNYYHSNKCLYKYLRRRNSTMWELKDTEKILDILKIQVEIFNTVKKYKNIEEYQKILAADYIDVVIALTRQLPYKYRQKALNLIKEYMVNLNPDKRIKSAYNKLKYKEFYQIITGFFSIKETIKYKQIKIFGFKYNQLKQSSKIRGEA